MRWCPAGMSANPAQTPPRPGSWRAAHTAPARRRRLRAIRTRLRTLPSSASCSAAGRPARPARPRPRRPRSACGRRWRRHCGRCRRGTLRQRAISGAAQRVRARAMAAHAAAGRLQAGRRAVSARAQPGPCGLCMNVEGQQSVYIEAVHGLRGMRAHTNAACHPCTRAMLVSASF